MIILKTKFNEWAKSNADNEISYTLIDHDKEAKAFHRRLRSEWR